MQAEKVVHIKAIGLRIERWVIMVDLGNREANTHDSTDHWLARGQKGHTRVFVDA
jgi:hypothetical protein